MSEPETGRAFVPERERLAIEAEVRASLAAKVLDEARDVVRILSRYEHGRMIDGTEFVGVFEVRLGRLIEGSDPARSEALTDEAFVAELVSDGEVELADAVRRVHESEASPAPATEPRRDETLAGINKAIDYLDPDFGVGPPMASAALATLRAVREHYAENLPATELIEGSDPASPEQKDGDFESMLAGYDRIIHDKALQQELLDAGLLVKVDPATGEPIEGSDPARSEDRHDMIATLAVAAAAASSLPTHPTAAGRPPTGSWPDPTSPEAALDAAAVHRILCFALIEHEPGTRVPYLWPCTKFLAEYARLAESSRG